jgi:hypothetical protein
MHDRTGYPADCWIDRVGPSYHDGPYCVGCGECRTCYDAKTTLWKDTCPDPNPQKINPFTGYGPHEWNKASRKW